MTMKSCSKKFLTNSDYRKLISVIQPDEYALESLHSEYDINKIESYSSPELDGKTMIVSVFTTNHTNEVLMSITIIITRNGRRNDGTYPSINIIKDVVNDFDKAVLIAKIFIIDDFYKDGFMFIDNNFIQYLQSIDMNDYISKINDYKDLL